MTGPGTGVPPEGAPPGLDPGIWRLAVVAGVRMDMPGEFPEVLVHEAVSPWRELAIPVGMAEGNAIAYAWRGLPTPRPLTHALFTDVLERHEVQLEAVRITARRGRSFFAELDTTSRSGRQVIACRPSDALALVLRQRMPTPVLVADWVFDREEPEPAPPDDHASASALDTPPDAVIPTPGVETPVIDTSVVDASVIDTAGTDIGLGADAETPNGDPTSVD
jgi:bifunctional DNase/RNase